MMSGLQKSTSSSSWATILLVVPWSQSAGGSVIITVLRSRGRLGRHSEHLMHELDPILSDVRAVLNGLYDNFASCWFGTALAVVVIMVFVVWLQTGDDIGQRFAGHPAARVG